MFQSSFELTGYITSKLDMPDISAETFQSSFELTGYITMEHDTLVGNEYVSKLF